MIKLTDDQLKLFQTLGVAVETRNGLEAFSLPYIFVHHPQLAQNEFELIALGGYEGTSNSPSILSINGLR